MSEPVRRARGVIARGLAARAADRATGSSLVRLDFALDQGVVALLGAPDDGSLAFVDVVSGRCRPERGELLVDGQNPHKNAAIRARMGVAAIAPELPRVGSVEHAIELASSVWAKPSRAHDVLSALGLEALASREVAGLSSAEARSVATALALATHDPALVVLFEPFSNTEGIESSALCDAIARVGAEAPVVVVTSSPRDAGRFDEVALLHRGELARATRAPHDALAPHAGLHLTVWLARRGRQVAALLAACPSVKTLGLETTDADSDACALHVAGTDADALAAAVGQAVVEAGAELVAMEPTMPLFPEIRALSEQERFARQRVASAPYAGGAPFPLIPSGTP